MNKINRQLNLHLTSTSLTAQSPPADPCWRHNEAACDALWGHRHLLFSVCEPPPEEQRSKKTETGFKHTIQNYFFFLQSLETKLHKKHLSQLSFISMEIGCPRTQPNAESANTSLTLCNK